MDSSTSSHLLHLRSFSRKDFLPDILKIGVLALSLTTGLILYTIWPIDNVEDVMMTLTSSLPILVIIFSHFLQPRIYPKYNVFVSIVCVLLLSITSTYALPRAGVPMMLAPTCLVIGSLASFNRSHLRWLVGLSGLTMLITTYLGARSGFAMPPGIPDNIWTTVGGVLIGVLASFGMLLRYHAYMTHTVFELEMKNAELEQVRDNLEETVRKRTQDLLTMIDDLERSHKAIQKLAITDSLTGIFNRRHFMDMATKAISPTTKQPGDLSIILFDVDDFKQINDNFGHQYGDSLLQEICKTIKGTLRAEDIFARYGGEEFIILLPNTDKVDAYVLAESIRRQVEHVSIVCDKQAVSTTISIGIISTVNVEHSLDNLLKLADQAQYRAKSNGKNCVCSDVTP